MKRRAFLRGAAATVAAAALTPAIRRIDLVEAAALSYWGEAQSWWNGPVGGGEPDTVPFPYRHVHMQVEVPYSSETVSGVVPVRFRAFTHEQEGIGRWRQVKWQDDKGGSAQTIVLKPPAPVADGLLWEGVFNIDTSKEENSGIRLWRFYAYLDHANGNVQVARPIYPVRVANGKPLKNASGDKLKPSGWYKEAGGGDTGYDLVQMPVADYPAGPVTLPWSPRLILSQNGGSSAWTVAGHSIHLDPDFHNGDVGTVLLAGSGSGTVRPTVPAGTSPGSHRLVGRLILRNGSKTHEGVGVYPFTVA